VRVIRHYVTRMQMDHLSFLEVAPGAGAEQVKAAFDRAAERYRPRALPATASPDTRRKAKELLARAVAAFHDLSDDSTTAAAESAEYILEIAEDDDGWD